MDYQALLHVIAEQYSEVLGENLVGIYVHGSIAFGCFTWGKSDVDFIVVVEDSISQQVKLRLLDVLESLRSDAPEKGFEMSVVRRKYCGDFVYPTPFELHFSNGWLEQYLKNPLSLCGDECKVDADLAAHFTVINHVGIALCGRPIGEVFSEVPKEDYLHSIRLDVENAEEDVHENPVYVILNLCRVFAYVRDGVVLSKEQGGHWGLKNLPVCYHGLLTAVLNNYTQDMPIDVDKSVEVEFCKYMIRVLGF